MSSIAMAKINHVIYLDWEEPNTDYISSLWRDMVTRSCMECDDGCGSVRPRFYGDPIDIELRKEPSATFLACHLALIMKRSLFDILSPYLEGSIRGACYLRSGDLCANYVTLYTPVDLCPIRRSSAGCRYKVCPGCGKISLRFKGSKKPHEYFTSDSIRSQRVYQLNVHCGLILTPDLVHLIDKNEFSDVLHYPIAVIDEPIDGGLPR